MTHDPAQELAELITAGRMIEAIRRTRELTGLGLADAKNLVERLAAGEPVDLTPQTPAAPSIDQELVVEIQAVAERSGSIEATRVLRQRTGCGLKDAKEQVEAITGQKVTPTIGCGITSGLLLLCIGTALGWLLR